MACWEYLQESDGSESLGSQVAKTKGVSLSYFLNLLDGFKALKGVLVIAICNEPDKLDPALIHRPSRLDRVWRFELPKYEQRLEMLRKKEEHNSPNRRWRWWPNGPKGF